MTMVSVRGIDICYDTSGDPAATPLLLVSGLGMQLTGWPPEVRERLVSAGYFVVAHDNRDVGLSTHLDGAPLPDLAAFLGGGEVGAAYLLGDMADDAAGLLEELGIDSAHIVGASMGGMIAQEIAIRHPGRVRSLTSIMSTTGDPTVGQPTPEALAAIVATAPTTRAEAIEAALAMTAIIGSPAYPSDPAVEAERIGAAYDRCNDPAGQARQLGAILASPDRTAALRELAVPTLVIHGSSDPLVTPSGGEATAQAIPGAELVVFEGMGHDLPVQLIGPITDVIVRHTTAADAVGAAR